MSRFEIPYAVTPIGDIGPVPRRGRPPLPPELRKPRRSGTHQPADAAQRARADALVADGLRMLPLARSASGLCVALGLPSDLAAQLRRLHRPGYLARLEEAVAGLAVAGGREAAIGRMEEAMTS